MNDYGQQPVAGGGRPVGGRREGSGLGGLWLLLVPLACCGGPLLIAALAAAGALAWGGIGLAGAVLAIRRRRRACRAPAEQAGPCAGVPARPPAAAMRPSGVPGGGRAGPRRGRDSATDSLLASGAEGSGGP